MNNDAHISKAVTITKCDKHNAEMGYPCWVMPGERGFFSAICNRRARRAGFVGQIKPSSMRRTTAGPR